MSEEKSSLSSTGEAGTTTPTTPSSAEGSSPPTGPELIDKMLASENSLNTFLDRDPHALPLTEEELTNLIRSERAIRASLDIKTEARKDKRNGND